MKRTLALIGLSLLAIPAIADAAPFVPTVYCGNLPGCGPGIVEYVSSLMRLVLAHFDLYVYILGALFVMIGGAYIVFAGANEEYLTTGRTTVTWALVGIVIGRFASEVINFIIVPEVQTAAAGSGNLVVDIATQLAADIAGLLKISLVAVALYGGMRMVAARGKEDEFSTGRNALLYGAIGAVIIQLAEILVNAVATL